MSGQMITFTADGRTCDGYLCMPESGSGPGVILIQAWWGLIDHIKNIADRIAAEGFVTLAPDLYRGDSATQPDNAERLMMALNIAQTEKDLGGAVQFLLSHDAVTGGRVGTVGFCMGGQLALFAACLNPLIGACVDYYGFHPNVQPDLARLQAPVLGLFAENDEYISLETVETLKASLLEHGKAADFHIYPGVEHGFFNDTAPYYNAEAAQDSWARVISFLRQNLSA